MIIKSLGFPPLRSVLFLSSADAGGCDNTENLLEDVFEAPCNGQLLCNS